MSRFYFKITVLLSVLFLLFTAVTFSQNINTSRPQNEEVYIEEEIEDTDTEDSKSQKIVYSEKQEKMRIKPEDIILVAEKGDEYGGGGFHLYVKKHPGIESILLTQATKDPKGKNDNYAYRAKEYNPVNGDEIRYLDGKPLDSEGAKYSLIDSTAQKAKNLGEIFHIYIPSKIIYGYDWTTHGEIDIGKGTFINIRSFEKPYADYTGDFMDSPYMFDLTVKKKKTTVSLTDEYSSVANEKLKEISSSLIYSKGPETIINDLKKIIESFENKSDLDLVLAIDTTGSMNNDMEKLKRDLLPMLQGVFDKNANVRIGLLLFRDYNDNYHFRDLPVKIFAFTKNFKSVVQNLKAVRIYGSEGGDIPEAIYEAIFAAADFYDWRENIEKEIILITDAEPHPEPRKSGRYTKDYAMQAVKQRNIKLHSILLPKD